MMLHDERDSDKPPGNPRKDDRFTSEYEVLVPRLMGYVLTATGDREIALDLLQEAMIRFWKSPFYTSNENRPAEDSRQYAFRIAANPVKDYRKSRRRYADTISRFEGERRGEYSPEVDPDVPIDMRRALQRLKPRERELLWLAHGFNYTHTEIAKMMGYNPLSIRVLLSRARNRLRVGMSRLDHPDSDP